MQYRQLGHSGVRVSAIGLGTNQFGGVVNQDGVQEIVHGALDLGINFFDTADTYNAGRSEETLGEALKGRWQNAVVATKVMHKTGEGPNDWGASRYHIANGVEASLRRLGSDHIDLYQIHTFDQATPIEETLRALDDLVRSGKVRYVGASNFAAWQLARANLLAEMRGWAPFVTVQPHYHMLERGIEKELVPYCRAYGVGILPYFPLAGGFLTGKYRRGEAAPEGSRGTRSPYVQQYMTDANYATVERLSGWAEVHGHNMAELAFAWLLAEPQVSSVIAGATRLDQVRSNAQAAGWVLTSEEKSEVDNLLAGKA
jgi:aryl-alcohol dehydrogenase-like predicted oxidoreductase